MERNKYRDEVRNNMMTIEEMRKKMIIDKRNQTDNKVLTVQQ